ncbi:MULTISPECIES: AHH domain-containing protein [Bacillus]|uniref:AHH domain-containing protein n=1 Tax=Bacillus TaxID=1386 RepID=UPI00032DCE38|nr:MULTISPECIES: AHH domain-containing protein [Bacillus cereus group]EOP55824.1 hypothetical protein IIW_00742 [Bacillus cereus VD136]EOP74321.1 hypothetical protein KOW_00073 [Bacillus cereus VDM006]EOQ11919.1 hypothetical protein KOY_00695 [Bacillus cereus VDM021]OOG91357.1 hypothetical protein BTH41_01658 [Bacillus mycoides]PEK56981.1 hypothetical protein CN590_27435 [Bacillus pseudomycoides]
MRSFTKDIEFVNPSGKGTGKNNISDVDIDIDNFNFGKYFKNHIGDPPKEMKDPYAHHILFKKGRGKAQQEFDKEGQEILKEFNIDPILGLKNLTWTPNRAKGQHGIEAIQKVVDDIKAVKNNGGDRDDMMCNT